jgi:hypothetical protein
LLKRLIALPPAKSVASAPEKNDTFYWHATFKLMLK